MTCMLQWWFRSCSTERLMTHLNEDVLSICVKLWQITVLGSLPYPRGSYAAPVIQGSAAMMAPDFLRHALVRTYSRTLVVETAALVALQRSETYRMETYAWPPSQVHGCPCYTADVAWRSFTLETA